MTVRDLPVIDVSPMFTGAEGLRTVARQIGAAARDIGFFSIVNHGVPAALCNDVFNVARAFFALTEAEKEQIAFERSPVYNGFSRMYAEKLHPDLPSDLKESWCMGLDSLVENLWPDVPGFRPTMLAYFAAIHALCTELHRAVAIDLGADAHYFDGLVANTLGQLRLLHYPPHPGAFDGALHGASPHTDYGGITFLMQDDAGGLEVQARNGEWIAVPPQPGVMLCNIGDALMRWSNDVYVSTPHRVVNTSGRERYSVVFFGDVSGDALIECFPSCTTPERPARYAPVTYAAYLKRRMDDAYPTPETEPTPLRV
jgi:isopenicillin N synthase-like dioxygenase